MSEPICTCRLVHTGFPPAYDNATCPTHGPTGPRYFVDHGTIHDKDTGKHIELPEVAAMLCDLRSEIGRLNLGTDWRTPLAVERKRRLTAEAQVAELEAALREALDIADEGWSYASDYFRDKHDSAGRIAECRRVLNAGKEGG